MFLKIPLLLLKHNLWYSIKMKTPKKKFRYTLCEIIGDDAREWRDQLKSKFQVCFKCGDPEAMSPDHHNPISCGFTLSHINATLLCKACNIIKSDIDPKRFYNKEELARLTKEFGVITTGNYNRNFNIEIEFLYELVKELSPDEIRLALSNNYLINNYVSKNRSKDVSNPDNMTTVNSDFMVNHLEKLIILDPGNEFFNAQYDIYLERLYEKERSNSVEAIESARLEQSRRDKERNRFLKVQNQKELNIACLEKTKKKINQEDTVKTKIRNEKEIETQKLIENSFNWKEWIGKEILIDPDNLYDHSKTTCLMSKLFIILVKRNRKTLPSKASILSFYFRYLNPESESKRVKIIVKIDGRVWFDVKVGAYSTLGKMMLRIQLRMGSYKNHKKPKSDEGKVCDYLEFKETEGLVA
jgi:hypothetical protein